MFIPSIVFIDYETRDSRGASFESFREDFRVFSLSSAWRDENGDVKHWFDTRPNAIKSYLEWLDKHQIPVVVHNLQFEFQVTKKCYPHLNLNFVADTMRLAKLRDSGGSEYNNQPLTQLQEIELELGEISEDDIKKAWKKSRGVSLEACAYRFLEDDMQGHKAEAHGYLEEHHGIKKNHGQYLDLLPFPVLQRYNNADTMVTLLLYESCMKYFEEQKFDVSRDWQLYSMRAKHIAEAYLRGIKINTKELLKYILDIEKEIEDIDTQFRKEFQDEITQVRKILYKKYRESKTYPKTERGKQKRWDAMMSGKYKEEWDFNINSGAHLAYLFHNILGIDPKFRTAKGAPSFKASHLKQWGKGGNILLKRKKRLLVLNQCVSTYCAAIYDSKYHPQVRADGTRTNRVSAGR